MRFMLLIKSDKNAEAGVMPGEALLAAMGKYNEELVKAGVLLTAEGLHPTSKGFRIQNQAGKLTQISGPFGEPGKLLAGFWLIQVKSKEEAIEWAKRVPFDADGPSATADGNGQIEIRQVHELEDFPVTEDESGWREEEAAFRAQSANPQPADAVPAGGRKIRYMMMFKADQRSESGALPDPKMLAEMGALMGEMAQSGVLLGGEGLQPSSMGARVTFTAGKRTVTDGPFTEAKELICGYCMVQVSSESEVLDWARRGLLIHGDGDSEIRRVFDAADFGPELTPELREAEERMRETIGSR